MTIFLHSETQNLVQRMQLSTVSYYTQIKGGFEEGKDLVVSVMSAMGEEQICALKDIGPKS